MKNYLSQLWQIKSDVTTNAMVLARLCKIGRALNKQYIDAIKLYSFPRNTGNKV